MRLRVCLLATIVAVATVSSAASGATVTLQNGAPDPLGTGVYAGAEDTGILYQIQPCGPVCSLAAPEKDSRFLTQVKEPQPESR